ncbi:MAG TPA: methyltransferase domain-containing protein [Acidimicrobiales bacterium]|nr:methyltransferase domain-containing protein [Acidimicrobiales bacterium]
MNGFDTVEGRWIDQLGTLRNVIRQEIIARQLADLVRPGMHVLDVGCGQGTQVMGLASAGCHVTGIDPSEALLRLLAERASALGVEIEIIRGRVEDLDELVPGRRFDLVCSHGLLMYLEDRDVALSALAARTRPGGKLSVTFRNGHALAMRPGLRGDWTGATAAFESSLYINELGTRAAADRLEDIECCLTSVGLGIVRWYGVRVFNDAIPADTGVPGEEVLSSLLDAEELAARSDPYRWVASQIHVIAERSRAGDALGATSS